MLHVLNDVNKQVSGAFDTCEFQKGKCSKLYLTEAYSALTKFSSSDLSSFYFDIVKDSLYNDAANDLRRRSTQSAMFQVLIARLI